MLEQIGQQLAAADDKTTATGSHVVLLLAFAWIFSGWLLTQNLSHQFMATPVMAEADSQFIVYTDEQSISQ